MSEQHTPTPWGFSRDDENGVEFNITSDKWYVAVCCDSPGNGTSQSNARRIVACVNACAGLSTQCLEETGGGVEHYIAVIKQRDELLAALEHILAGSLSLPRFAEAEAIAVIASVKDNT